MFGYEQNVTDSSTRAWISLGNAMEKVGGRHVASRVHASNDTQRTKENPRERIGIVLSSRTRQLHWLGCPVNGIALKSL